jgi:hypothetical protein
MLGAERPARRHDGILDPLGQALRSLPVEFQPGALRRQDVHMQIAVPDMAEDVQARHRIFPRNDPRDLVAWRCASLWATAESRTRP